MVMQHPLNVRQAVQPRLQDAMRIIARQYNLLDKLQLRLHACAQPSRTQLASHRAHEQGDARLLRSIIAVLTASIPQLAVAANLLTAALKHALDSGAARDALPFLGHNPTQDQIEASLLDHPPAAPADFDPQHFHVYIHVALSLLRLTMDCYLERCIYILRRLGLPRPQSEPIGQPMVQARTLLKRAVALLDAAMSNNMDAIYGPA